MDFSICKLPGAIVSFLLKIFLHPTNHSNPFKSNSLQIYASGITSSALIMPFAHSNEAVFVFDTNAITLASFPGVHFREQKSRS